MVERGRQLGRSLPHLPSQQHDAAPLPLPQRPPPNPRWEGGLLLAPLLLPLLLVLPPLLLPKSNLASKLFQVYNRRKIIFLNIHRCQMSYSIFFFPKKEHAYSSFNASDWWFHFCGLYEPFRHYVYSRLNYRGCNIIQTRSDRDPISLDFTKFPGFSLVVY